MISRYDAYKDSGVEWIGEIPEHWEMIKLKYLGKALIGLSYQPDEVVDDDTQGILVLRSSNIQNGKLSLLDNVYVKSKVKEDLKVKEGDILICSRNGSRSLIGKNITISKELVGNTFGAFMTVLRTRHYKFISKVFNSRVFSEQSGLFLTSTINQLTQETLNNFLIPFTHLESEQTQIVSYLDEKTALIDKLISVKQRKIELLKEKRTALINQAVTKGLNPNVKMKDSGIEWIGEIPEHWECSRVKQEFEFHNNKRIPLSAEERSSRQGEYRYYGASGVIDFVDEYLFDGEYLLIGEDGANILNRSTPLVFSVSGQFWVNNHAHILKNRMGSIKFFEFQMEINDYSTIASGSAQPKLTKDALAEVRLFVPPEEEQTQIVSYLDEKTKEIDNLLNIEQKKIDLLKEYRQSLISEVVTGKIKVTTD